MINPLGKGEEATFPEIRLEWLLEKQQILIVTGTYLEPGTLLDILHTLCTSHISLK